MKIKHHTDMKPEDKQLLFTDLCARLPYGVKIQYDIYGIYDLTVDKLNAYIKGIKNIKPYLRPMSSMTEEEKKEFKEIFKGSFQYFNGSIISDSRIYDKNEAVFVGEEKCGELIDWLNKKMFDYRGLIPKGLAISTEIHNPYKD